LRRGFVIHHNGPPADCLDRPHSRCEQFWNSVRSYHVYNKGWSDIAYSFGVCPHGTRFVGRGWDKPQFANGLDQVGTYDGKDSEWFTVIVFLGIGEEPTAEMYAGVTALIGEGRTSGRCGDRILPHNAFKQKACPGPEFTAYAAEWDDKSFVVESTPAPVIEESSMFVAYVAQTQRYYSSNAGKVEALTKDEATALTSSVGGFRMHVFNTDALWRKVHGL
jgi:hypothetical protein